MNQKYEKITDAWVAFKPNGFTGMLYQAPAVKPGKERITAKVLADVVSAYVQKYGVYPSAVLVNKEDDPEKLSKEVGENFPDIGEGNFLSPGYGYIFLKHDESITNKPKGD